ncbi:MAG TPA: L,D-transpeptidase family protein [Hyphomicrobiaceae bacterium]|nr:L,D-transpeptidase family protein [Hyphomicrobiaceae bacterium]
MQQSTVDRTRSAAQVRAEHARGSRLTFATGLLLLAAGAGPAVAADCPALLATATQLVLVTAAASDGIHATLQTFERAATSAPWQRRDASEPAVLGRRGLGLGWPLRGAAASAIPAKVEGDGRTPAGVYRIGAPFGSLPQSLPGYMQLRKGQQFCVDDPRSVHYGRIVPRSIVPPGTSGEDMGTIDLYRRGFVIDYPANAQVRGGSCVFLHVWRAPGKGTAGCVAASEATLARLQAWVVPGKAVIAVGTPQMGAELLSCLSLRR